MLDRRLTPRSWKQSLSIAPALLALVTGSPAAFADTPTPSKTLPPATPPSPEQRSLLLQMQDGFTHIASTAEPWVVNVKSIRLGAATPGDPSGPRAGEATGSGVIVRSDGYILTNEHVVSGTPYVTITLLDGREFRGKVSADFHSDLAIVKVNPGNTPLPTATFADSDCSARPVGGRYRQPLRFAEHDDRRHYQRGEPAPGNPGRRAERPLLPGSDPNGRGHQSGQLRRPATEH